MKSFLKTTLIAGFFLFMVASPVLATVSPAVSSVSAASKNCDARVLGIPPWYRGLTTGEDCAIKAPDSADGGLQKFIWTIVLNIIEMLLVITAYVAVFFILYGGFLFIVGGSSPDSVSRARKTILNAVIGLIIAMSAITIANTIFTIIPKEATNGIPQLTGPELFTAVLNLFYFLVGAVSVIVIIIAGFIFVTSSGNPSSVTRARNMMTYSIVGLIIVLSAFAITSFITGRFN